MSPSTTYYFHIGMPKTGTTSLQMFLRNNYQPLIEKGCLYPDTGRGEFYNHSLLRFAAGGYKFWSALFRIAGFKEPFWLSRHTPLEELKNALSEEVEKTGVRKVIISSELLSLFMTKGTIKKLLQLAGDGAAVKAVIYIRRQDQVAQSLYGELIKNRTYRMSLRFRPSIWGRLPFLNYFKEYAKWADVIGRENVIVKSYEQLHRDDIVHDFLNGLGMDGEGLSFPETKFNPHLNSDAINALREANQNGVPDDAFLDMKNRMATKEKQEETFNFMNPEELAKFNRRFDSSNKELARQIFDRDDLFA